MALLIGTDNATAPGVASLPVFESWTYYRRAYHECDDAGCLKRYPGLAAMAEHKGCRGVGLRASRLSALSFCQANIESHNTLTEKIRLAQSLIEFYALMVAGIGRTGIPPTSGTDETYKDYLINRTTQPWKEFGPWDVDSYSAEYLDLAYTIGGIDSDPTCFRDNHGRPFTWSGWGVLEFCNLAGVSNSKLGHTARLYTSYYDPDETESGIFRLYSVAANIPTGGRLWEKLDPDAPIQVRLRAWTAPGREPWIAVEDAYPAYAVPTVWGPGAWPVAPEDMVATTLFTGQAMIPQYGGTTIIGLGGTAYYSSVALIEIYDGTDWVPYVDPDHPIEELLRNELNVDTGLYEATLHLELMDLSAAQDLRATILLQYVNPVEIPAETWAYAVSRDRCDHARPDYSDSVGVKQEGEIARWHCDQHQDITEAIATYTAIAAALGSSHPSYATYVALIALYNSFLTHFATRLGVCWNQDCPFFQVAKVPIGTNFTAAMTQLIQDRPFRRDESRLQTDLGAVSTWAVIRVGTPSVDSLAGTDRKTAGINFDRRDWLFGSQPTLGKLVMAGALGEYVSVSNGLEFLEGTHINEAGPAAGLRTTVAPRTDFAEETADDDNDPNCAFRNSMTCGQSSLDRHSGAPLGKLFVQNEYPLTWLQWPMLVNTPGLVQRREVGTAEVGYWTPDLRHQESEDGETAYHLKLTIGTDVRPLTLNTDGHALASLGTATVQETFSPCVITTPNVSGAVLVGLALVHRQDQLLTMGGTGEDDRITNVWTGGTNVYPHNRRRMRSPVSRASGTGAGAGEGFLHAGRALRILEDADLPEALWGRLLPVRRALDSNPDGPHEALYRTVHDPETESNETLVAAALSVGGDVAQGYSGASVDALEHCDTIEVEVEADTAAVIEATEAGWARAFDIVQGARAVAAPGEEHFWASDPTAVTDTEIVPAVLYHTGELYLEAFTQCPTVVMRVLRLVRLLSQSGDIDTIGPTISKLLEE